MNVHVHVEWLQECYEYGTSYRTWDPLFRTFFYLSCTAGCVCVWVTGMGLLHFQQSRDELVWVTIICKAAIFLALCLHSAIDELHVLRQHSNKPIRKPSENVSKGRTQRRKASLMRAKIV